MEQTLGFKMIDGIKCYSFDNSEDYSNYPIECFDIRDEVEDNFWLTSRNRLLEDLIIKYSLPDCETKFLEIGCANGLFLEKLAKNKNIKITGSEIYLAGLKYAREKLRVGADLIQFDVEQGILPDRFDIIGSFDVIEHIENDVAAIANIYAMLNPGGNFILTVPQYMFLWSKHDEMLHHKRRYSRKELLTKLTGAGFEIKLCSSWLFCLFPLMLTQRLIEGSRLNKKDEESFKESFKDRESFPKIINRIFDKIMLIDEFLIKRNISLPFGGSLLVIAKRIN
ncbi:MAG: class I SAM-dependent methyltransferase [Pseudomonadota bacterium]